MEEDLRAHLAANAGLAALVADRIQWGETENEASIGLFLISGDPDQTLKGPSGLVQSRVQCDCIDATFLTAKAIGDALTASLPAIGLVVGATKFLSCVVIDFDRDSYGEKPNLFHRTRIDVRVSYRPA